MSCCRRPPPRGRRRDQQGDPIDAYWVEIVLGKVWPGWSDTTIRSGACPLRWHSDPSVRGRLGGLPTPLGCTGRGSHERGSVVIPDWPSALEHAKPVRDVVEGQRDHVGLDQGAVPSSSSHTISSRRRVPPRPFGSTRDRGHVAPYHEGGPEAIDDADDGRFDLVH